MPPTTTGSTLRHRPAAVVVITIAAIFQLIVLVPFTTSSGLMAPLWAIIALHATWVVGAAALIVTARRQPFATPLVPVINGALWFTAMTLGERLLGWTA